MIAFAFVLGLALGLLAALWILSAPKQPSPEVLAWLNRHSFTTHDSAERAAPPMLHEHHALFAAPIRAVTCRHCGTPIEAIDIESDRSISRPCGCLNTEASS